MKELWTRSISGILYVGLLVASLYTGPFYAYNLLLLFNLLALIEFQKINRHKSPFPVLLLIGLVYFQYKGLLPAQGIPYLVGIAIVANTWLGIRLFAPTLLQNSIFVRYFYSYGYLTFSAFSVVLLTGSPDKYLPGYLLITFILIWTNNSFAYLTGKKWGKTFLFPSISPKKTWEGFWGGTIATLIAALLIAYFDTVFNYLQLFILGVSVSILATLGDLVESQFKRLSGVKDSGSLIPGHGGFYDRMDSVIYTAPFMLIIIQILAYVS